MLKSPKNCAAEPKVVDLENALSKTEVQLLEFSPKNYMPSQSDHCRWRLRPDVVATVLNDGAVILDLRTKFFFSANPTAWSILQMFESGATPAEVLEFSRKWGANGDTPAVNRLIGQIIAEGLVEPVAAPAGAAVAIPMTTGVAPELIKHEEPLQRIMVSAFDPGMPLAE
jgi:hypothetical protein